jgi:hypothetical protein
VQRKHFLVLAGVLACFFSLSMLFAPAQMLSNMTTITDASAPHVFRWLGSALLAVGVMNLLARNDPGSDALRAIMVGNIVLHAVAIILDLMDHIDGIVNKSGIVMGGIVHLGLIAGFAFYLSRMRRAPGATA